MTEFINTLLLCYIVTWVVFEALDYLIKAWHNK